MNPALKQFIIALAIICAAGALSFGLALAIGLTAKAAFAAGPEETLTVTVTDAGPQPAFCTVKRSDNVRWFNATSQPIRVIGATNDFLDTGDIAPGATSGAFSFDFISSIHYDVLGFDGWVRTTDVGGPACAPEDRSGYHLTPGWNLLVWRGPDLPIAEAASSLTGAESIYAWDGDAQAWLRYVPGAPEYVNSIETMVAGRAYWVKLP